MQKGWREGAGLTTRSWKHGGQIRSYGLLGLHKKNDTKGTLFTPGHPSALSHCVPLPHALRITQGFTTPKLWNRGCFFHGVYAFAEAHQASGAD